jgi:hydroxyethylthiazole kinase
VGEVAAEKCQAAGLGVGSMQAALLDGLQLLDQAEFERRLKMTVDKW